MDSPAAKGGRQPESVAGRSKRRREQSAGGSGHGGDSSENPGASPDNTSGQEGQDNADNQPPNPPPPVSEPEATTAEGALPPVTITFIGQVNAGKSSLANSFLQIKHFIVQLTRTTHYEDDFNMPGIRIRALPGYGSLSGRAKNFLGQYPIDPSEVVILVLSDEMDHKDKTVLRNLLDGGHPPERILLVRNKFDATLKARMERQNIVVRDSREQAEKALKTELLDKQREVLKGLQKSSAENRKAALQTLIERKETPHPLLIFTSASDISTFTSDQDRELVNAISASLTEQERHRFMAQFIHIRPGNIEQLKDFIGQRFLKLADEVQHGRSDPAGAFNSLLDRLNNVFGLERPDHPASDWEEDFRNIFGVDFKERIGNPEERDTLQQQFTAFYTRHILGSAWYQFIRDRQREATDNLGQTPLHRWARTGRSGWVWLWLQLHGEQAVGLLDNRDINGRTPLHLAVYSGSEETVQYILEHGGDPNAKDRVDYTPLHWAAYYGQEGIAQQLIDHRASLHGNHWFRVTPLHIAAWCNQGAMVKKLLEHGADINASAYGDLPVHYAASTGSLDSLTQLLSHQQIRINAPDPSRGYTALHHAAWHGHKEVVARLIENGANQKALTPERFTAGDLARFRKHDGFSLYLSEEEHNSEPESLIPVDIDIPIANQEADQESQQVDQAWLYPSASSGS